MNKQEIQDQINELQKQLDKCIDIEPFACKGKWYTENSGQAHEAYKCSPALNKAFNYWQTKEIAKKAHGLQLRHRKMLSFVS